MATLDEKVRKLPHLRKAHTCKFNNNMESFQTLRTKVMPGKILRPYEEKKYIFLN